MAETDNKPASVIRVRFGRGARVRPPAQITALDVDGTTLRVATGARRGSRVEFTRVAAAPLALPENADTSDAAVLGKAIGAALETLRLKPGSVAMSIPREQVLLRTLSLPELDDVRELASMIRLQVGKDLPYRKEDAVIDFELRPLTTAPAPATSGESNSPAETAAPTPKSEALVAVAQQDVVQFYRDVCAAAELKLAALTLRPFANAECLNACRVAESEEVIALVALHPGSVGAEIIRDGKVLFSREAELVEKHHEGDPAGGKPVSAAGEAVAGAPDEAASELSPVERITIEVIRTLHAFGGMMPDRAVSKFILTSGTGLETEVADAIAKRLNVPASVLDVGAALEVDAAERAEASGAFSAMGVVIAATDPDGMPFNFLDPKRPAVQRDMKRVRTLAAVAAVVVLFAGVLGVRSYLLKQRALEQQKLQNEINTLAKNQPLFRRTRGQAATIQGWLNEEKNWLEHYAFLSAVLPGSEEIYITSLSISPQGTIRLAVQARSGEVLARLDKRLREAGYDVKPQAITPGTDRYGYDFKSSVELIVPPKLKIDLSKVKPPPRPADDVSLNPSGKTAAVPKELPAVVVFGGAASDSGTERGTPMPRETYSAPARHRSAALLSNAVSVANARTGGAR